MLAFGEVGINRQTISVKYILKYWLQQEENGD